MLVDRLAVVTTPTAVNQALLQSHMTHDSAQLPVIQPFLSPQDSIDAQLKEAFRDFTLPSSGVRSVFLQDLYEANSHVPFGLIEVTVRLVNHLKSKLGEGQFAALYDKLGDTPHDRWAGFVDSVLAAIPNDIWTDGLAPHRESLRALWIKLSVGSRQRIHKQMQYGTPVNKFRQVCEN